MGAKPPPMKGGLGTKTPSLEIPNSVSLCFLWFFLHFTTYLSHPKPPFSQQVLLRLLVGGSESTMAANDIAFFFIFLG